MKFSLKQTSLLDASGELSAPARRELLEKVTRDPVANAQYEAAHRDFSVFGALPIPEPSAAERKFIPAMIKKAIHGALSQHEKRAGRSQLLLRCAAGGMALAACVVLFSGLLISRHNQEARQQAQVARIQAMIERVTLADGAAGNALARPLVITTPSQDESNGLNTLAVVPEDRGEPMNDASAPPGSF